jgi:hypothetical protein
LLGLNDPRSLESSFLNDGATSKEEPLTAVEDVFDERYFERHARSALELKGRAVGSKLTCVKVASTTEGSKSISAEEAEYV